jgi:DNA adenine methylase
MARTNSPLRYPGGKSCLIDLAAGLLHLNGLERGHYAEPYAGGCGLALSLLYGGYVSDIHINDIDPAIWAFWYCVLKKPEALAELVNTVPVTIDEWLRQRDIYRKCSSKNVLALGFSAFFLNRTNRSGIINGAGVIGGLEQVGKFKLDCRYNREDLTCRILRVGKYKDRIHLTRLDAQDFMISLDQALPQKSLFFIDPPYYCKGADLYTSSYKPEDHAKIAETVTKLSRPWVVTYDDVAEIRKIYSRNRQYSFDIAYSVREKKLGAELMIASKRLRLPAEFEARLLKRPRSVREDKNLPPAVSGINSRRLDTGAI